MLRLIRSAALACAWLLLLMGAPARAQMPEPATWFAFELNNPAELLAHPKDAGLREALRFVPERLAELAEANGAGAQFEQVRPLLPLLGAPMRVAIAGAPPEQPDGPAQIGVVAMSMHDDRRTAEAIVATLLEFLDMQGMLEPDEFGLGVRRLRTPLGEGDLRVVEREGGFAATLTIGRIEGDPFASLPRVEGDAIMRMVADFEAASWFTTPLAERFLGAAELDAMTMTSLHRLLGERAPLVEFTMRRDGDGMLSQTRTSKVRPNAASYWISEGGLSEADLRAIPAHGAMGGMYAFDLAGF